MTPSGGAAGARKPVAFGDMRGWIEALRAAGELREVDAEVDWDVELGTIYRMAQGKGDRPAFLFKNIKDYNGADARCREIFVGGQGAYSRLAMMFGLERDTPVAGTGVASAERSSRSGFEPVAVVKDGPVKRKRRRRRRRRSAQVPRAQMEPAGRRPVRAHLRRLRDQGSRTPEFTTSASIAAWSAGRDVDPGAHVAGAALGRRITPSPRGGAATRMPVAYVIGWEPSLGFTAGAPVPRNVSEYEVMGAIRGEPVDLVPCETVPLMVPASAEIVIEGWISTPIPSTFSEEGPYAEFTGYYATERTRKHTTRR